jgi:putative oxidoreductase
VDIPASPGREVIFRTLFNRWVQLALRVGLGGFFVWAGILKVMDPQEFADNIAAYQILPYSIINFAATSLPVFEILVGAMLVIGFQVEVAAFSVLILCGIFAVALASALIRGLKIDCGCLGGGAPSTVKMWFSLGRDFLFGSVAWFLFVQKTRMPNPKAAK